MVIRNARDMARAGREILRRSGARHLLVTRGEQGMTLFEGRSGVTHIPTVAKEVFDVTGAGDTVVAACALALASRAAYEEAAVMANLAAGIVVGEVGTAAVTSEQLKSAIHADLRVETRPVAHGKRRVHQR
jgi:D-beta-D-heptose 7-phosphate kinase/D-beta-D-heptose 1-phosphate adenosyltransferase